MICMIKIENTHWLISLNYFLYIFYNTQYSLTDIHFIWVQENKKARIYMLLHRRYSSNQECLNIEWRLGACVCDRYKNPRPLRSIPPSSLQPLSHHIFDVFYQSSIFHHESPGEAVCEWEKQGDWCWTGVWGRCSLPSIRGHLLAEDGWQVWYRTDAHQTGNKYLILSSLSIMILLDFVVQINSFIE